MHKHEARTDHKVEFIPVKILRQDSPNDKAYWQEFKVKYQRNMNIITVLREIQKNPQTVGGETIRPVVWDSGCLEEVCGACSMNINGQARQACSTLVDCLELPIVLEPFKKFPCTRDLIVDRSRMFEALKKVKGWIPVDGTYDLGPGPKMPEPIRAIMYEISKCMTCGCCLEVCPNVNQENDFIGAAAIAQTRLFNSHPTGAINAGERLDAISGEGGITGCGNAQNCVAACPRDVPLTDSIAEVNKAVSKRTIQKIFGVTN